MFPALSPAENAAMQQIAALQHVVQALQTQLQFAQSLTWPQQQEIQRLTDELASKDEQIKDLQRQLEEAKADTRSLKKDLDGLKAEVSKLKKRVDVRSPPNQNSQTSQRQPSQNKSQYLQVPGQQTTSKPQPQPNDYQPQQTQRHIQQQQPSEQHSQQSDRQTDRSYSHNNSYSDRQQRKPSDRDYNNNDGSNSNRQQPPDQHRAQQSGQQYARGYSASTASNNNRQQQLGQQRSHQTSQPSDGGYSNKDTFNSNRAQQPAQQRLQQASQHSASGYGHDRNVSYSNLNTSAVPSKPASTQSFARGYVQNNASSSSHQQQTTQPPARGYGNNIGSNNIRHDSALPAKPANTQSSGRGQGRDTGSGRYPYDSAMPTDWGQHDLSNRTYHSSVVPYDYKMPSIRANTETSTGSTRPETSNLKQQQQPPKLSSKKNTGRLQPGEQFSMSSFEEELRRLSFDTDTRAVTGSMRDTDSKGPICESEDDPFVDSPPNRVAGFGGEPGPISLSPVPLPPGLMSLEETMQMIESEEKQKAENLMVKYETRDDRLATTAAEIDRICQMIARWSASFCSKNGDIDLQLQGVTTTDVSRLALVVESLAPLPPSEAKEYALELLRSRYTSQLLATIVWRFLQQRMMQPDILTGLLPNTFEKVVLNQQQLMQTRDTDTSLEERARMIRERGDAVNEILQHREFIAFRVSKVKEVITELRPIVKPFFGAKGVKTAAALELNDIGMKVFDLLINTLTESGVFVTKWANIRQSYVPSAMRAPFNREPPSALWSKRVQLSIFPSITFRDDSAGNIYTKMTNSAVVVLGKGDLPGVFAAKQ